MVLWRSSFYYLWKMNATVIWDVNDSPTRGQGGWGLKSKRQQLWGNFWKYAAGPWFAKKILLKYNFSLTSQERDPTFYGITFSGPHFSRYWVLLHFFYVCKQCLFFHSCLKLSVSLRPPTDSCWQEPHCRTTSMSCGLSSTSSYRTSSTQQMYVSVLTLL